MLQALLPYVLLQKDLVAGVGAGVICYQHAGCDIRHGPTPPDYGRKPGPPKPPYPELVPFSQAVDTKRMGGNLGALSWTTLTAALWVRGSSLPRSLNPFERRARPLVLYDRSTPPTLLKHSLNAIDFKGTKTARLKRTHTVLGR